ncbi:glycosyltransferase [Periweissella fabaria]|uniref:UDP-N-acetylglucosamine--peptide N-acetylglucosaminyltransferase GtfA subunit n=1 Tax=Periweissella fabaria TaxID=546157 RepID=A0ABM8Z644_9LACO|nr:glycosyltransferase [Periweissella fabaria]MCM0597250.1 glycosyltransferase [Periweissella fabaria]CAH0416244.1 UDP-N-acetylglucosamine--peptide N-acetylglucosaminyltransferase GtfA subunit [Periweissella fabaria]
MIYFINFGMPAKKSGIEHAQLKRAHLFDKNKTAYYFLTRDWVYDSHVTAHEAGINDSQMINMFDFYQQALFVEPKELHVNDIEFGLKNLHFTDESDNSRFIVKRANNQMVARFNYIKESQQVYSVEMFDGFNNLYRVDFYDQRGFCSKSQWYTPDNKIGTETWYTPGGQIVLRNFNRKNAVNEVEKTGWLLSEHGGTIHQFDTIDELFEFFLNQINEQSSETNIFVLDRSSLADQALTRLHKPAFTVMYLHSSQAGDAQDPMNSVMNNNYEYALTNVDKYSAVVSATQKQAKDVKARFPTIQRNYVIPVGVVPEVILEQTRIKMNTRTFGKIVAVARIAYEKRLGDLIRAVALAHEKFPEVSLDLYGYADSTDNYAEKRKITALIKELDLEDVVTFKGYIDDVQSILDDAQIFGLTSLMEGFNLAIMEAISHGVVGITYDVNYGPNEIIQDNINGYVVPFNDYKAMGAKIISVLTHKRTLQRLSNGAYESAHRYSEENVWQAWQQLLDDAKTLKVKHVR